MLKKVFVFGFFKIQYCLLTLINCFIPKNENFVYLFDKKLKKDNVWAIALYLAENDIGKKYTVFYYTKNFKKHNYKNIVFINNPILSMWKQLRSKYIFYSYRGDGVKLFRPTKNQIVLDTMHGSPLKKIGYLASKSAFGRLWRYERTFSYILCVSIFFKDIIKECFGVIEEQCLILGYPRNDFIFHEKDVLNLINIKKNLFQKIVLWMPTWRKHKTIEKRSETEVLFPILNVDNIERANQFLLEENILLIIKPHPHQLGIELFKESHRNIKILKNEDLDNANVNLYELFPNVDALLTDYSSVYFDFLLTMKPIGFTIDDFDSYGDKRGFSVDNPLEIMPGEKIYNMDGLMKFFLDLKDGNDKYYDDRLRINNLANKYQDGNSTKRLVEHLGM